MLNFLLKYIGFIPVLFVCGLLAWSYITFVIFYIGSTLIPTSKSLIGVIFLLIVYHLLFLFALWSYYQVIMIHPGSPPPELCSKSYIERDLSPKNSLDGPNTKAKSMEVHGKYADMEIPPLIPIHPFLTSSSGESNDTHILQEHQKAVSPTSPSAPLTYSSADYHRSNFEEFQLHTIQNKDYAPSSASSTVPFTIPQDNSDRKLHYFETKSNGRPRFCQKCQIFKPDRSHHCSTCNSCILKMDHHCPWVNNCVGFRNYKAFILFLFFTSMKCLVIMFTLIPYVTELFSNYEKAAKANFQIVFLLVVSFAVGIALTVFTSLHFFMLCKNQTTIESLEKRSTVSVNGYRQSLNIYNVGVKRNIRQVFGDDFMKWFIPIPISQGSGLEFPINQRDYRLWIETNI